jgi:hypothetical protein
MRRNRRRSSARLRKNPLFGADVMTDVVKPVAAGTAGFVTAKLLSNAVAKVDMITKILDKSDPAAADNTKIVANVLGIGATLFAAPKVKIIADNRNALVIGMGLALLDRVIAKMNIAALGETYYAAAGIGEYVNSPINGIGEFGEYVNSPIKGMGEFGEYVNSPINGIGEFGEYVNSPINGMGEFGEYVNSPINGLGETYYAAAGTGEYVNSPINGLGYIEGVDPADQGQIDSLMDTMEAAAGVGAAELSETASRIGSPFGVKQFETTFTPVDVARPVTHTLPEDLPVTAGPETEESLPRSTPEGRGYAGGVFARNLFSGMVGG